MDVADAQWAILEPLIPKPCVERTGGGDRGGSRVRFPAARSAPPNGHAVQLHPTTLTANAGALRPPPERYHESIWSKLLGVSCSRLIDGTSAT